MSLGVKFLNFVTKTLGITGSLSKSFGKVKGFVKFGNNSTKLLRKEFEAGTRYYVPKPGIKFPTCPETRDFANPIMDISKKSFKNDIMAKAELGNVSLRLEKLFAMEKPEVDAYLHRVFPGADFSIRSKSSNSIFSKLKKAVFADNAVIKTDKDARKIVRDSIGGRITLPNLSENEFMDVIKNAAIDGKPLTAREKRMVRRYFRCPESLTPAELKTAKSVEKEVKILLAERQVEPVYNRLMLGMMKDALSRNITTIEKLEASGINPKLIEQLKTNPNIEPFRVTKFCNYRGPEGIAYFSDRQINQIKKMQLATGEKFSIATCDADIDLSKYGLKNLDKDARDAIKKSGYTTAQMNFMTKDGNICELQISGKGTQKVYHPEHAKYDATQGKNTLGPLYDEYKALLKDLKQKPRKSYDKYFNDLYNSSRTSMELHIKTPKPKLPETLDPSLSIENMIRLQKETKALETVKYKDFKPYYAENIDFAA